MPSEAQPAIHVDRRRPGLALLVGLLAAVPYVIGLVLPYYVNGVHLRPAGGGRRGSPAVLPRA